MRLEQRWFRHCLVFVTTPSVLSLVVTKTKLKIKKLINKYRHLLFWFGGNKELAFHLTVRWFLRSYQDKNSTLIFFCLYCKIMFRLFSEKWWRSSFSSRCIIITISRSTAFPVVRLWCHTTHMTTETIWMFLRKWLTTWEWTLVWVWWKMNHYLPTTPLPNPWTTDFITLSRLYEIS